MNISGEDGFSSGEGADQHQQRGLREVEVGEQAADDAKFMAGADEYLG